MGFKFFHLEACRDKLWSSGGCAGGRRGGGDGGGGD